MIVDNLFREFQKIGIKSTKVLTFCTATAILRCTFCPAVLPSAREMRDMWKTTWLHNVDNIRQKDIKYLFLLNKFKTICACTESTVPEIIDPVFAKTSQNAIKWKRAFWACFHENWVYKFGHRIVLKGLLKIVTWSIPLKLTFFGFSSVRFFLLFVELRLASNLKSCHHEINNQWEE
jgi:hypothetical protein